MKFDGKKLKALTMTEAYNRGKSIARIRKSIMTRCKISKSVLNHWESGTYSPSTAQLLILQKFFGGIDIGYFVKKEV